MDISQLLAYRPWTWTAVYRLWKVPFMESKVIVSTTTDKVSRQQQCTGMALSENAWECWLVCSMLTYAKRHELVVYLQKLAFS